ncbi:dihydropteroate synthase [Ignavibacterium sp.]|uniref:dihydropteroate synthase n=1 Tax=Ignavibacterium sp. TaxID=2651167 RepID=UPI00307EAF47
MIAQIFHCEDTSLLRYLSKKYSYDFQSNTQNFLLEIRTVQTNHFNESKIFLEEFIPNKRLLFVKDINQNYDLIFRIDSLSLLKEKILELKIVKSNLLLEEILVKINNYFNTPQFLIGEKIFSFDKPYLMGIVNVTPDSFSDGGKYFSEDSAVAHAIEMIDDGVDIIDVGGESSRPGSEPVSAEEEMNRVIPVIKKILDNKPEAIISVDTYKSSVAKAALETGAKIINDISGFSFDPGIADVCAQYNATAILMHIKGTPKTMQLNPAYDEIISEIYDFLKKQIDYAQSRGVTKIIIDPGIGFGKTVEDNFTIHKRLKDFKSLGCPLLIGVSRKSLIGKTLNLEVDQRDLPTAALEAVAILNSARIIRTHNVKNGKQIIKLLSEII